MNNVIEHQESRELLSDDIMLWKYMSFEAFTAFIINSALWFTRVDKFPDKSEGLYPLTYYDVAFLAQEYESRHPNYPWNPGYGPRWQAEQTVLRHKMYTKHRIRWAVSSWRKGDKDSEAMWATYSRLDSGIAIVSDVGRLRKSFQNPKWLVNIESVQYVDRDSFRFGKYKDSFLCKDDSFVYEHEIRAYIDLLQGKTNPPILEFSVDIDKPSDDIEPPQSSILLELDGVDGAAVEVSLSDLICRVVLAPQSPEWIVKLVQQLVNMAELQCDCKKSSLYEYPKFR